MEHFKLSGIGLNLSATDGLTGIDMDHVIQPDGSFEPKALPLINRLLQRTYVEVSPSGTGLRAWGYGKPQRSGKCVGTDKWLEIYSHPSNRYLTVTGLALPGSYSDIGEIQDILDEIHAQWMAIKEVPAPAPTDADRLEALEDDALLDKARNASNGDKFTALWRGDLSAHGGDPSSADLALCSILAFWTDRNPEQMDRLFRLSELHRPKWDEQRGAKTYGEMTIDKAISLCTETYSDSSPEKLERDLQEELRNLAVQALEDGGTRQTLAREFLTVNCLRLAALRKTHREIYAVVREQLREWLDIGSRDFEQFLDQRIADHPTTKKHRQTLEEKERAFLYRYVYQTYDDRYIELATGRSYTPHVFTNLAIRAVPDGWDDHTPQEAFSRLQGQFVSHECYYPGEPRIVERESCAGIHEPLINVYNPSPNRIEPRQNDDERLFFLAHLSYVCGGDDTFVNYLLDWMAYLIQYPGRRANSVPLIIGPKGNGKTFIADVLVDLLGKSNVSMISNDDLSGAFQDGLGFKQLLVLEEFKVFEGQHTMLERFKPWVTNDRVGMNRKGLKKLTIDNIASTIAFSNHEDAIRIDKEERRYGVAISRDAPHSPEYYKRLFDTFVLKYGGSPASILHLLQTRDLSRYNANAPAPWTNARDEMIVNTWSPEEGALEDMLELGSHGLHAELVTYQQIQTAFNTARVISRGTSAGTGSRQAIAKAAKAVGIQRLRNPVRLVAGAPKQTVVYSTRNHAKWQQASDEEIRAQLQAQAAQPPGVSTAGAVLHAQSAQVH